MRRSYLISAPALALAAAVFGGFTAPSPARPAQPHCQAPSPRSARAAEAVARQFVVWAVLRRDPLRARALVTSALAAGTTRADWQRGFIPVVPFIARGRIGVTFHVDVSCRRSVAFDVVLRAIDDIVEPERFRLEERRRHARWLVDYWGPPAIPAPPG